jgi:upstream activation factor subunit UAF30
MVRPTKANKQPESSTTTVAPVEAPAPAAVEVSAPTSVPKQKRTKKSAEPVVEQSTEPVNIVLEQVTVHVSTESVPAPVAAVADSTLTKINEFSAKLQQLTNLLSTLKNDFKTLEKGVLRDLKTAQKSSKHKKKNVLNAGNRQPSGFVKPTRITEELAQFLGKKSGTEMARTEVSKEITNYIRSNKLQNPGNGRIINADQKLTTLLKLNEGDELTYFNLQRYMKPHFIKPEPVVSASV